MRLVQHVCIAHSAGAQRAPRYASATPYAAAPRGERAAAHRRRGLGVQRGHARQRLALQQLQAGAAAGGDVAHPRGQARLLHRAHGVAAADDRRAALRARAPRSHSWERRTSPSSGCACGTVAWLHTLTGLSWAVHGTGLGDQHAESTSGAERARAVLVRSASACATPVVPAAKRGHSNTPMGPFHSTVRAPASAAVNALSESGPTSRPCARRPRHCWRL